ncbi:arylsulfatase [Flammeovirga sp. SubArs3]|uniref:arylsulfatase n=1 Tax=Flammeovirga sp. SubArs3 TaxID=2995316 RepID=UPI00248BACE4|nr:arylsulfatase [Flammeovirga sp. SubArs3]
MIKQQLIISLFIYCIVFGCTSPKKSTVDNTHPQNLPNIVYILADDLGYGDLGCYGQEKIETPNIDLLAKNGMLFRNHYAGSSVCAPSRSTFLTGLHTGNTAIRGNKPTKKFTEGQVPLPQESITIAELLKEKGYITGAFGKWGLGYPGSEGDPNNQGFDEFYGYNCQKEAHRYYPKHLWHNDKKVLLEGNDFNNKVTYSGDLIHQKALEFIDNHKSATFFLYYPNLVPHAELLLPEGDLLQKYRAKFGNEEAFINNKKGADYGSDKFNIARYASQPEPKATYAAMISLLDQQVGEVIAKLEEHDLLENTIVIFTSDNGPHTEGGAAPDFFNSNGGLRGVKRDLYEGGIKVPMIVRWDGVVPKASVSDHVSAFWDMMPTFSEIADLNFNHQIDGISIVPTLKGEKQSNHQHLYWEFHEKGGRQAIRQGHWKLVKLKAFSATDSIIELYNLDTDPYERNNLSEEYPAKVNELLLIMSDAHSPSTLFPKFDQHI